MPVSVKASRDGTDLHQDFRVTAQPRARPKNMILKHLKQATGSRHAALESRLPLLDAGMSRLSYLHFLQRFYGYYAPLESQFFQCQPDV